MLIQQVPIDILTPYDKNPRKNAAAIGKVAQSIMEFGFRQPIVVNENMVIIAGHTRYLAAKQLGMTDIPVHIANNLTEKQVRAYRLADNCVAQESSWDIDLLKIELGDLADIFTGFDQDEIDKLLDQVSEGLTDEDTAPEVPVTPITALGDVWVLSSHRIMCGDSTSADAVDRLLGSVKPHLMVTDPPYGVEYDADWRNQVDRKNGKPFGDRAVGKVENDNKADWSDAWALFPGNIAYVWHAGKFSSTVQKSLEDNGFVIRSQIIWAKNRFAISRGDYHWQHEPCWYAVKGTGNWMGDRSQTTLWSIPHNKSETGHSTQKPVECMRRPIVNNSSQGQAIYEPFSGSGTTIIAAEQTGRHCYAMELSPAYVDVAVKRWQDFSGKLAILESTGETFNDLSKAPA